MKARFGPLVPDSAAAVLASLHLCEPDTELLHRLTETEWAAALHFCDRSHLTLAFRERAHEHLPPWVAERTAGDAAKNRERLNRLTETLSLLTSRLHPIEFVVLKGITQTALSGARAEDRVQYDIDLYAPGESTLYARDILLGCGYEPLSAMEESPTDHLPAMIRKTGWEWRDDYFDPEIPYSVELHFRLWNAGLERLDAPGTEEFWQRRVRREIAGLTLPVLRPADALAYTALHVLRHMLQGSLNAFHVYELALILERTANDEPFWGEWQMNHPQELQRLQAVSFELARVWFGCALAEPAAAAIQQLPEIAQLWFETFAFSPVAISFRPNKDELWLHLALLGSLTDRWSVVRRRLLPGRLPGPVDAVHLPSDRVTWRRRWLSRMRYAAYVAGRVTHHASAMPRTLATGALWCLRASRPANRLFR